MRHATILVAILAFVPLASATGQVQQPPIERGARVRVTTPPPPCPTWYTSCTRDSLRRYVGTFVEWKADTLVVETKGHTLALLWDSVTKLEVSQGQKRNTREGALMGLLVGGVAGAVIAAAIYEEYECGHLCFVDPATIPMAVAVGVGLGGVAVGATIGSLIKTDRWQEAPLERLRLQVAPQRDGRFGLGASVRF